MEWSSGVSSVVCACASTAAASTAASAAPGAEYCPGTGAGEKGEEEKEGGGIARGARVRVSVVRRGSVRGGAARPRHALFSGTCAQSWGILYVGTQGEASTFSSSRPQSRPRKKGCAMTARQPSRPTPRRCARSLCSRRAIKSLHTGEKGAREKFTSPRSVSSLSVAPPRPEEKGDLPVMRQKVRQPKDHQSVSLE